MISFPVQVWPAIRTVIFVGATASTRERMPRRFPRRPTIVSTNGCSSRFSLRARSSSLRYATAFIGMFPASSLICIMELEAELIFHSYVRAIAPCQIKWVVFIPMSPNLEEPCLKVELLFVDRTRAANPIGVQAALQLDKEANVIAVTYIDIEHVPLVEIGVHEGLLAPVVVSDLFPNFASFAAYGYEPVISTC